MHHRQPTSRRAFMMDLGRGTLAVAILGLTTLACADGEEGSAATGAATPRPVGTGPVSWERVNLGFVSAYILARGGEAAVVDTGVAGSEGDIEAGLTRIGLGWSDVGHVIITHLHADHQGSLGPVMDAATDAIGYAGTADLPEIESPRAMTAVGDGHRVFGLEIIDTPGHTPGHISVLDPAGGLLVAGDAMTGADGGVGGANPGFTADMAAANRSIRKLAGLSFDTVLFGHGEPVIGGADAQVAAFAATL
jgi:glyoxylase-like metal-dependent hydrolase (beta-lactamase superfamily II)